MKDKMFKLANENEELKCAMFNLKNLVKKKWEGLEAYNWTRQHKEKFEDVEFWYNKIRSNFE